MSWLQVVNFLVHCIAFSDSFPQHGKAWKSMESMGTSLFLQIGYTQRILIAYFKTTLKALNFMAHSLQSDC